MPQLRINVFVTIDSDDFARFDGVADLEAAIKARLLEIDVADGGVIMPRVLGIDVEDDDVVDLTYLTLPSGSTLSADTWAMIRATGSWQGLLDARMYQQRDLDFIEEAMTR